MNISDIITQFGAYYIAGGQGYANLKEAILRPTDMLDEAGVQRIRTKDTAIRTSYNSFGDTLQPFQAGFTPSGTATFKPRTINLQPIKSDVTITDIDTLVASWLGFLAGDSSKNREEWPFVRYMIEKLWLPKFRENLETNAIYKGKYVAPTTGTASTPDKAFDGLREKLKTAAAFTAAPANMVNTGVLATNTIYDQMKTVAEAIVKKYAHNPFTIYVAPELAMAYKSQQLARKEFVYFGEKDLPAKVLFSNCVVKGVEAMSGTTDWFATPSSNIMHITKMDDSASAIKMETSHRVIDMLFDYWFAVDFDRTDLVFTNTQTITDPNE